MATNVATENFEKQDLQRQSGFDKFLLSPLDYDAHAPMKSLLCLLDKSSYEDERFVPIASDIGERLISSGREQKMFVLEFVSRNRHLLTRYYAGDWKYATCIDVLGALGIPANRRMTQGGSMFDLVMSIGNFSALEREAHVLLALVREMFVRFEDTQETQNMQARKAANMNIPKAVPSSGFSKFSSVNINDPFDGIPARTVNAIKRADFMRKAGKLKSIEGESLSEEEISSASDDITTWESFASEKRRKRDNFILRDDEEDESSARKRHFIHDSQDRGGWMYDGNLDTVVARGGEEVPFSEWLSKMEEKYGKVDLCEDFDSNNISSEKAWQLMRECILPRADISAICDTYPSEIKEIDEIIKRWSRIGKYGSRRFTIMLSTCLARIEKIHPLEATRRIFEHPPSLLAMLRVVEDRSEFEREYYEKNHCNKNDDEMIAVRRAVEYDFFDDETIKYIEDSMSNDSDDGVILKLMHFMYVTGISYIEMISLADHNYIWESFISGFVPDAWDDASDYQFISTYADELGLPHGFETVLRDFLGYRHVWV